MKTLLCSIICLFSGICGISARTLSGRVISPEGEPLAFANVVVLSRSDSTFVSGSVSGETGSFKIPLQDIGKNDIFVRVTYVGYDTAEIPVGASDSVGDITLKPASNELGEIIVSARKPSTKLTGTGLLTNVANTDLSYIGSAKDALRFIPLLVNIGDSWTVLTKGTPVFYINDRKMRDKNELETIRSLDIISVEVITNPGAQYPPDTPCVVKIKTRRPQGEGLSGSLSSNTGYSEKLCLIENANLNYRHGKVDVFLNGHYNKSWDKSETSTSKVLSAPSQVEYSSYSRQEKDRSGIYVNAGISYTLDENTSFGASYTFNGSPRSKSVSTGWMDATVNGIEEPLTETGSETDYSFSPYHYANAYYTGHIGKTYINLNADYYGNTNRYDRRISETNEHSVPTEVLSTSRQSSDAVASKLIASNTLWDGKIEYGVQYYHTSNRSSFTERQAGTTFYHTKLREQNIAPFIEYSRNFPFGYIIAGLRYEHTDLDYFENFLKDRKLSRSYNDFLPSLTWARQIGQVQLQANYRAYSGHPPYSYYNDEVKYVNRFMWEKGNPDITDSKTHSVDVMGMWKYFIFNASYTTYKNMAASRSYIDADNPDVEIMTVSNLRDRIHIAGMSVTAQHTFGCYSPQLSLSLNKPWFSLREGDTTMSFNKPTFGIFMFNQLSLPKDWMVILQAMYRTKGDEYYSRSLRENFDVTGVVYKWFFNRTLQVSLIANDIFHTSKRGATTYYGGSTATAWTTSNSRSLWVGVTYTFNATESKYRGKSSIEGEKQRLDSGK